MTKSSKKKDLYWLLELKSYRCNKCIFADNVKKK